MLKEIKSASGGKTRTLISLILIILTVSAFIYNRTSIETVMPPSESLPAPDAVTGLPNVFLIGVCNGGYMPTWNQFQELNMNLWHEYPNNNPDKVNGTNNQGWTRHIASDLLENNISVYGSHVQDLLDTNDGNNLYTLMNRVKIDQLGYGARSDYQAEHKEYIENTDLDFYCYNTSVHDVSYIIDMTDNTTFGQGARVKRCVPDEMNVPSGGQYILKDLNCNREQADMNSKYWIDDWVHKWIVKPKIRVPQYMVDDYPNTNVCRIDINKWDGTLLRSIDIKAGNFKDNENPYWGQYIENYFGLTTQLEFGAPNNNEINPGNIAPGSDMVCNIDFRVWWYGECEMWIDYVRVDNDIADKLFKGYYENPSDPEHQWLQQEAQQLACHNNSPIKFYIDEFEFNNLPCLAYVSRKLKEYSTASCGRNINFAPALNYGRLIYLIPDKWGYHQPHDKYGWDFVKRYVVDSLQLTQLITGNYPFYGKNSNYRYLNPSNPIESKIPETLPRTGGAGVYADPLPIAQYDGWLQTEFDKTYADNRMSFCCLAKMSDYISNAKDIPYIHLMQTHVLYWGGDALKMREPTNEELKMMANVAVSYGAKGILYFDYLAYGCKEGEPEVTVWGAGLTDVDPLADCHNAYNNTYDVVPRQDNVYRQYSRGIPPSDKYATVSAINAKLKTWEPYLMSFTNADRSSYIYRTERGDLMWRTYFKDVVTYRPGSPQPSCKDTPEFDSPPNMIFDCEEDRYVQVATFKQNALIADPNAKFFMIVNRRCSPHKYDAEDDNHGGKRKICLVFWANHSEFEGYNNWEIYDLGNPLSTPIPFDKRYSSLIDLGQDFMPGEGRLYQIVPVMKRGGTLVADENISGEDFTCLDTVYNNEHNITIGSGTSIHFTDLSKIIMNGGTFQLGDPNYNGPCNVSIGAASGNHWTGFDFNNCTVKVYNTAFSGITNDTNYAINIIDCPFVDIQKNTFNCSDNFTGAVNLTYYSISSIDNAYIGGNTISVNSSAIPVFNILSYAGITIPLIAENNTFTSSSALGSTAIMLSGITGGAIKNNTITNYEKSINALSSSLDISGNNISSNVSSSKGISGLAGTELKMNNSGDLYLGGMNSIFNTGESSFDLFVENSYFLLDNGENIFDIASGSSSYHLYGSFPESGEINTSAVFNCFKVNNTPTPPPVKDVVWGEGGTEQVSFTFEPYLTGCTTDGGEDFIVNLGNGLRDTITERVGGGGAPPNLPKGEGMIVLSPKQMYDSICIQTRFRNYNYVKTRCMDLINAYPDSIQGLNAIPKLYLATTASDTSQSGISALKTYYENLILNHTNNTALINRCNYFVQKCKVRLRQYSSALAGFQQIINNNPYSYEALVAKWDYMATHLLDSLSSGGESGEGDDPHDKFTKEQRQVIKTSVSTALLDTKIKEEKKIEVLTVLANIGNSLASAQLQLKKTLKEVSRPQTPHSIMEHVKIVNNDIQKVFGNPNRKNEKINNIVPKEFRLSQNYPNPFNPVTKIQYDLPKDVKVKLIIYDILGREVIRLVNNDFKQAGRYTVEFNGNNYASGVYFYRIEAGDPSTRSGQGFVQSKKMVLVK